MFYLTVHDLVWINAQLCGEGVPFDYEKLEAGMAAQYAYGYSRDVFGQGATFVETMVRKEPFREGNLRTALVSLAIFLLGNDVALAADLDARAGDIAATVEALRQPEGDGMALLEQLLGKPVPEDVAPPTPPDPSVGAGVPRSVRSLYEQALSLLSPVVDLLAPRDGAVDGWHSSPYLHRD